MKINNSLNLLLLLSLFLIISCTSGKRALTKGNYEEAFYKSVRKLRSTPNHSKSKETLKTAYPYAKRWNLERIQNLERSSDIFKWERIAPLYGSLNQMYEAINQCPGCLKIIPNPDKFYDEFEDARFEAAEVRYNLGEAALAIARDGNREKGKEAFTHYFEAGRWVNNYKDVEAKLNDAEFYATLKVLVEPIPMHSRNLQLSNEFFDNKINEFLLSAPVNRFVRFYTPGEAERVGLRRPDHILQLVFDDFVLGQTFLHEKETTIVKDSVILGTYEVEVLADASQGGTTSNSKITICHVISGNRTETITVDESALKTHLEHGDKIGACGSSPQASRPPNSGNVTKVKKNVYGQAKATLHVFTKTLESRGLMDFRIIDGYTNRVITQEKLPGTFVWQTQWGFFNGDERALSNEQIAITKARDVPPPSPQELFVLFTQPIYSQITLKIRDFYRNF
jgi:tetratricopeptide (TPR) repeat protein